MNTMIRWSVLAVVGASATLVPAQAVPVVPNFTQGSMTSHTETTQTITETINSMDYSTGYQYSATGSGVTASGNLSPGTSSTNVTIEGVTSQWTGEMEEHTSELQSHSDLVCLLLLEKKKTTKNKKKNK